MKHLHSRRKFYCKIFDQTFSSCGQYLAVGDSFGRTSVYDLDKVLAYQDSYDADEITGSCNSARKPYIQLSHPLEEKDFSTTKVFSLAATDVHLICGDSNGEVFFYRWSDLEGQQQGVKPVSSISVTSGGTEDCPAEVNSLVISTDKSRLISGGAGDNCVKIWNLEYGKLEKSLSGHRDYIHEVVVRSDAEILSASEDGTVRFWDLRSGSCEKMVKPSEAECGRQQLGIWLGCVSVDEDWMVCGGGPALGLWHIGSMSLVKVLNAGDCEAHAVLMYDNKIITGGSKSRLYHWNFKGDPLTEVPVSPLSVYSIAANNNSEQYKILTACGSSSRIDVFINPGYRAFSLETFA